MQPNMMNPAAAGTANGVRKAIVSADLQTNITRENGREGRTPQEQWRARNPLAAWAHAATRSALKRGLIERQPCRICGAEAEAHHPNYLNPLQVDWLCRNHHRALHAEMRREAE